MAEPVSELGYHAWSSSLLRSDTAYAYWIGYTVCLSAQVVAPDAYDSQEPLIMQSNDMLTCVACVVLGDNVQGGLTTAFKG